MALGIALIKKSTINNQLFSNNRWGVENIWSQV